MLIKIFNKLKAKDEDLVVGLVGVLAGGLTVGLTNLSQLIFIGAKPTHQPCKIVRKLKGNTSRQLRLAFRELRYLGYKQHYGKGFSSLWAVGYYCGSAGHVSQEQVKRYILEQQGKDVFEYDIFNCPQELKGQLKIGDFS